MRFIVSRTSDWCGTDPPCDSAYAVTVPEYDVRSCDEIEFNRRNLGGGVRWRDAGTDHTVLPNGWIRRQTGDAVKWAVDLADLRDLMSFISKYGRVVVSGIDNPHTMHPSIEIYDTYRE